MGRTGVGVCVGVLVGALILIAIIVIAMSFQYVNYYEYGILRQRSTGHVNRDEVFENTRIMKGPDYELVIYPSIAQFIELEDLAIATKDNLGIDIDVSFQYFLRKEDLIELHDTHKDDYEIVIKASAADTIKDVGPDFATREYIENRRKIEEAIFRELRVRLEGECCILNCETKTDRDCKSCVERSKCNESQHGVFVEIRYFQLGKVHLQESIRNQMLQSLILTEDKDREELERIATITRINSDFDVKAIKNDESIQVNEIRANIELLRTKASAEAEAIVEKARGEGLVNLYNSTGLTDQQHKNTFDYLRTIRDRGNIHLTVNYDQKISGSWVAP